MPEGEDQVQTPPNDAPPPLEEGTLGGGDGGEGAEGGDGGQQQQPPRKFAGTYDTVDALEHGKLEADRHIVRIEEENARLREESGAARARSEAQVSAPDSGGQGQKTDRQIAEEMAAKGDIWGAVDYLAEAKVKKSQKPILDRAGELERAAAQREAEGAYSQRLGDAKRYPKFGDLEKDMTSLLEARKKANPSYEKGFRGYGEMFDSLYYEVRGRRPDLFQAGRGLAAAAAGGGTGSGSVSTPQAQRPQGGATKTNPAVFKKFGLPANPFQDQPSIGQLDSARQG
jgi:hypothetical protein